MEAVEKRAGGGGGPWKKLGKLANENIFHCFQSLESTRRMLQLCEEVNYSL